MSKGIVIGAGRSFWESNVMNEIKNAVDAGKCGHIKFIISDRIAKETFDMGISPDRCNIVVVTQEVMNEIGQVDEFIRYYKDLESFDNYFGIFISRVADLRFYEYVAKKFPIVMKFTRKGKYNDLKPDGMIDPIINTCGHVGMACYGIAITVLGCDSIAFIGVDLINHKKDSYKTRENIILKDDRWKNEAVLTINELENNSNTIAHFNLSPYGLLFDHHVTINCSLRQFLENDFKVEQKGEIIF